MVLALIQRLFKSISFHNAYERARKAANKARMGRFRTIKKKQKAQSAEKRNKG